MEAQEYEKLVKALRCCAGTNTKPTKCPDYDDSWCDLNCLDKHLIAAAAIEALQAQLPKQGEWIYKPKDAIEMMFTLPKCSVCGHESSDANNYCPNCGAKMTEVQE